MEIWQTAAVVFFGYLCLLAVWRSPRPRNLGRIFIGSIAGLLVVAVASVDGQPDALRIWIWPPLVLLIAYWSSGLLFVAPRPRQEQALRWLDDRMAHSRRVAPHAAMAGRSPRGGVRRRLPSHPDRAVGAPARSRRRSIPEGSGRSSS